MGVTSPALSHPLKMSQKKRKDTVIGLHGEKKTGYFMLYSSWWFQPISKILVNLIISPGRDENKTCLKPPPSTGWFIGIPILA